VSTSPDGTTNSHQPVKRSKIANPIHLVHEIAVLADQRRSAGLTATSDALEEWHRYSLPSFTERMKMRLRSHCQEEHQSWPAKGRHTRHTSDTSRHRRMNIYAADTHAVKGSTVKFSQDG
jgi:hypothetical protein